MKIEEEERKNKKVYLFHFMKSANKKKEGKHIDKNKYKNREKNTQLLKIKER